MVSEAAVGKIARARKLRVLPEEQHNLLLTDSICPVPLHKALLLREAIEEKCSPQIGGYARLALAKTLVHSASNLHFGPEVGVISTTAPAVVITHKAMITATHTAYSVFVASNLAFLTSFGRSPP